MDTNGDPYFISLPDSACDWTLAHHGYKEDEEILVPIIESSPPYLLPPPKPFLELDDLSSPPDLSPKLSSSPPPQNNEPGKKRSKAPKPKYVPLYLKDPTDLTLTVQERARVKKSIACKGNRIKNQAEKDSMEAELDRYKAENARLDAEITRLVRENEELKELLQLKNMRGSDHAEINFA